MGNSYRLPRTRSSVASVAVTLALAAGACTPDHPPDVGGVHRTALTAQAPSAAPSPVPVGAPALPAKPNCSSFPESGEPRSLALARCLAEPIDARAFGPQRATPQAVLYLDHSASMRGFLHPLGGNPASFQTIVDRILAGAQPVAAFAYGSSLVALNPKTSLAAINTPSFYSATNTLLEQVLDRVARDSTDSHTHIIIGDGRRGSPGTAEAQFSRMRSTAVDWIAHGGVFMVATTMAPFQTVPSDPSGCRTGSAAAQAGQVCPLYAFIFVAPPDVQAITSAASEVFEHIFVWPVPTLDPSALTVARTPNTPQINVNPKWLQLPNGQVITRVRGVAGRSNSPVRFRLSTDTTSPTGRVDHAILDGERIGIALRVKSLAPAAITGPWANVNSVGGLARIATRADAGLPTIEFITHGHSGPEMMIVADIVPTGAPEWLEEFDAKDSSDTLRTYGLSRLFAGFQLEASQHPRSVARYTFVAN